MGVSLVLQQFHPYSAAWGTSLESNTTVYLKITGSSAAVNLLHNLYGRMGMRVFPNDVIDYILRQLVRRSARLSSKKKYQVRAGEKRKELRFRSRWAINAVGIHPIPCGVLFFPFSQWSFRVGSRCLSPNESHNGLPFLKSQLGIILNDIQVYIYSLTFDSVLQDIDFCDTLGMLHVARANDNGSRGGRRPFCSVMTANEHPVRCINCQT